MMLDHYSASQINQFAYDSALWIIRRFMPEVKGSVGPGAWRGTACEAALDRLLYFPETHVDEMDDIAFNVYDKEAAGEVSDAIQKERDKIPAFLANLEKLRGKWDVPMSRQMRIETWVDGIDIPVIGFVDYGWEGRQRDLKTAARMPSLDKETGRIKDKWDHLRQVSIYNKASGRDQSLIYVTPGKDKEPLVYDVSEEELSQAWKQVEMYIRAMHRLNRAEDSDFANLAELFPPSDLGGYRWDHATRAAAATIWSL